jgi:hypothetical protein
LGGRLGDHQGETFRQIRGEEFRYRTSGTALHPDRTNQALPKSHFRQAYDMMPLTNTVALHDLRGPSYIYAVLMDARIRQGDW